MVSNERLLGLAIDSPRSGHTAVRTVVSRQDYEDSVAGGGSGHVSTND